MCDVPTTMKDVISTIVELENNFRRHEKSMRTAKTKLDAAKAIVLKEFEEVDPQENWALDVAGGIIKAAKARKTQALDNSATGRALELKQAGLGLELAKYGMTDVREWLSPKEIDLVSTTSFGSRTLKIVADKA
jgi:hypothetical protein